MILYKYNLVENCPLEEHKNVSYQYYYRITNNNPPKEVDFIPQYWSQPNKRARFKDNICGYQGVSFFATLGEAENMLNKFRSLGNYIHKAENLERYATIRDIKTKTHPTHVNVYPYKDTREEIDILWELEHEN